MGGDRPVKVKCWEKFLKSRGCAYVSTEASHDKWKCPDCFRPVMFRGSKKEIPFFHISTNLTTLKIGKADFLEWVKNNC